jgi:hypothetical protein
LDMVQTNYLLWKTPQNMIDQDTPPILLHPLIAPDPV